MEIFYLMMHSTHFIYTYMALDIWLLFQISSKGSFICTILDTKEHTTTFIIPVVEHLLEREIAQWVLQEGLIQQPITQ